MKRLLISVICILISSLIPINLEAQDISDDKILHMYDQVTHKYTDMIKEIFETSAFELKKDFIIDYDSAREKYLGKYLTIDGVVSDKGIDPDGFPFIIMGDNPPISFHFSRLRREIVEEIKKGDVAIITGNCTYIYPAVSQIYGARVEELRQTEPLN